MTSKRPPKPQPPRPGPRKAPAPPLPPPLPEFTPNESPTGKNTKAMSYAFLPLLDKSEPDMLRDVAAIVEAVVELANPEDRQTVLRVAQALAPSPRPNPRG